MTSQPALSQSQTASSPQSLSSNKEVCVKCVLMGEPGVGKSSLFQALTNGQFSTRQSSLPDSPTTSTLNPASQSLKVSTSCGAVLTVDLWDTAGQERFHSLTHSYYRGAGAVLLLYDQETRRRMHDQFQDLHFHFKDRLDKVLVFVLATKADLDTHHMLSERELQALCRGTGVEVAGHFRVSALTGQHVQKAWQTVIDWAWHRALHTPSLSTQTSSGAVRLHSQGTVIVKHKCAC